MAEKAASLAAPCWSNMVKQQAALLVQHRGPDGSGGCRVFVESCKSSKGIAIAVVDANAIIQGGERLPRSADNFMPVTEVMNEIRDPGSRYRLSFVPFTVEAREPTTEALKKVISFARATGDLQTLSDVDLKLVALTYMLEAQIHGTKHLRDRPPPKDMPWWGSNVPNLEEWEALEHEVDKKSNSNLRILPLKDLNLNVISMDRSINCEDSSMGTEGEPCATNQGDEEGSLRKPGRYLPKKKEISIEGEKRVATRHEMYESLSQKDGLQDVVENIEVEQNDLENESSEQSWMLRSLSKSSVACVTSDFAMQNVLWQMGLRLLAPGGMQISQLYFSLPLPQDGRDAINKNPILREDQLPRQLLYPKRKKKNKQGDDDSFSSGDIFSHHTDKRAPLRPPGRKALAVFSGKRNPNDKPLFPFQALDSVFM
ncbi:hypothetical protein NMG60_11027119 [Bertholletia excelsa]